MCNSVKQCGAKKSNGECWSVVGTSKDFPQDGEMTVSSGLRKSEADEDLTIYAKHYSNLRAIQH